MRSRARFYKPKDDSPEIIYLHERRKELGGYLPSRECRQPLPMPDEKHFAEFYQGSDGGQHDHSLRKLLSNLLGTRRSAS